LENIAINNPSIEFISFLLDLGTPYDINSVLASGPLPLEIVQYFFQRGSVCTNETLESALRGGQPVEVIKFLMEQGAEPTEDNFIQAVTYGASIDILNLMTPYIRDMSRVSTLMFHLFFYLNNETIEFLKRQGTRFNYPLLLFCVLQEEKINPFTYISSVVHWQNSRQQEKRERISSIIDSLLKGSNIQFIHNGKLIEGDEASDLIKSSWMISDHIRDQLEEKVRAIHETEIGQRSITVTEDGALQFPNEWLTNDCPEELQNILNGPLVIPEMQIVIRDSEKAADDNI
jgi:hypothetical protein